MDNLASILGDEKHYSEVLNLQQQALQADLPVLGPDHPYTLYSEANVGNYLSHKGHYAGGAKLFRQAIQTATKTNQPTVLATLWYHFGATAAAAGRRDDAFTYLSHAVDAGFSQVLTMQNDDDLKAVRQDHRFAALLAKVRQNASKSH